MADRGRHASWWSSEACVLLSVAAWLGACSSSQDVAGCSGDVEISVVRFDPPVISWTPDCGVSALAVDDAADRSMWSIVNLAGENAIVPPVTFGIVPDRATEEMPRVELQHGNFYIVRVYRVHRDRAGALQQLRAGEQNFPW
jgi:hypothetical protein